MILLNDCKKRTHRWSQKVLLSADWKEDDMSHKHTRSLIICLPSEVWFFGRVGRVSPQLTETNSINTYSSYHLDSDYSQWTKTDAWRCLSKKKVYGSCYWELIASRYVVQLCVSTEIRASKSRLYCLESPQNIAEIVKNFWLLISLVFFQK